MYLLDTKIQQKHISGTSTPFYTFLRIYLLNGTYTMRLMRHQETVLGQYNLTRYLFTPPFGAHI